ncbi:PREDICTED: methylenetetrahydrofolate reductase, partial [Polistes dominula]|uniref:Methylenetetrahydrofolate reductase n=1 Tax=Polistes dominula TaxID=743375 RepID=A0ABM1HX43_POLDO
MTKEETFEENINNSDNGDVIINNYRLNELIDLRQVINEKINKKEIFYSFELFPMNESKDIFEIFFTEMNKYSPVFYALAWSATNLYLSLNIVKQFPPNTLLHVAVKGLKRCNVEAILKKAYNLGIRNIFALLGDSKLEDGDFPHAIDLVQFIRSHYGKEFNICVAGYPDMHPLSPNKDLDLFYLKAKVDAGADFIITQMFFESNKFINFVNDCRNIGITVPIIPGIFPIFDYKSLKRMTNICQLNIPNNILNHLEKIKDNDEEVEHFGIELTMNLIKDIIESQASYGFHFFTL